ncbi:DUF6716 putative glycosyltransferase [Microbacterium sp. CFBP9034]|uniref:DUF6716 putative glycosyltransferase n=1 Tax=Microbacterium sp. CFBP9034 TaxID=3096540 RepID=UPI002A6A86FB|nr:DUF6716 putative glycosyltransferase [Microbacterium sp. CFBP9034]MDY0909949.1 DUF6716 putative glycosyltransferase [Microbacterium sp. CFBP9034]
MTAPRRIVALADTDSYVKWAAALLGTLDAGWDASILVVETPLVVSDPQLDAALSGSDLPSDRVSRVGWDALTPRLSTLGADVVVLAGRGPLVRVLAREVATLSPRPVIVAGLPGISIPATRKAIAYRAQADLFVLHSHRECRDFAALSVERGMPQRFALATLPFARGGAELSQTPKGTDLIFAPQAKVPADRPDRMRIARLLVRTADADPSRRVVVKLRAERGEQQTHAERDAYPDLLASLGPLPPNLVTSTASMHRALDRAEGLVTVSSTAAIEAIARGIPVIALDTFGVAPELINEVMADAGLLSGEQDVVARRFRHPDAAWLDDNYFHDAADDDWTTCTAELVAERRGGTLEPKSPLARRGGALRDAWERKSVLGPLDRTFAGAVAMVIGMPLRFAVRVLQRLRDLVMVPRTAAR